VTSKAATAAALSNVLLQVTPENVLEVRKTLLTAAERLKDYWVQTVVGAEYVGLCGGDPVSEQAAIAFSDRIAQTTDSISVFGIELRRAGEQLSELARAYGYSEAQVEASFKPLDEATGS
jgi:hypothetical protein